MINESADACAKLLIEAAIGVQFVSGVVLQHSDSNVSRGTMPVITMWRAKTVIYSQRCEFSSKADIQSGMSIFRVFGLRQTLPSMWHWLLLIFLFFRKKNAPYDSVYYLRQAVAAENFAPRITPYLCRLTDCMIYAKHLHK